MTEIKSGRKAADVRLFIAMLALDGRTHCVTTGSLLEAQAHMIAAGIPDTPHVQFLMQDSNVPFSRNRAVAQFMLTDCTDLIFIDSDVSWDAATFLRLICHPVEVVGATYRQKIQDPATGDLMVKYAVDFLYDEDGDSNGSDPETGLLEVKRLPTGFLRISRSAIQRMINECDVPEYPIDDHGKPLTIHRLFSFDFADNQEISEDYRFCDRWRSIGGKVWCDPEMRVHHHGLASFSGHLGEFMRGLVAAEREKEEIDAPADMEAA